MRLKISGCSGFIMLCLLFPPSGEAQAQRIEGRVVSPAGEPLAFVTVISDGATNRCRFTDIEGRFETSPDTRTLTFKYIGFEEKSIALHDECAQNCTITLHPLAYQLSEVSISAGENPADILIRKAVAHRRDNNPELRGSYQCDTYNKVGMELTPDRNRYDLEQHGDRERARFEELERNMKERQAFLMENVTRRRFRSPGTLQEEVLLNRVSGFHNSGMVALANAVQPFSMYGDQLTILDKNFVNPISPGSAQLYFFHLADTLYSGADTVWVVEFKPRKGKVFMGLRGVLHINSNQYALQYASARPAMANKNFDLKIEQAYQWVEGESAGWFPSQLHFEMSFGRYPADGLGLKASGRCYITNAVLNPPLRDADFNAEQPLFMHNDAETRHDSIWTIWREPAPLSDREIRTYAWLDSVGQVKRFDAWGKAFNALNTGLWPLRRSVGLDLLSLVKINDFERFRPGLGLTNAQYRPLGLTRRFEWRLYGGYGLKDKQFKYAVSGLWRISRSRQATVSIRAFRDLSEPGAPFELTDRALADRSLYARRMDLTEQREIQVHSRLFLGGYVQLSARSQSLQPSGYAYRYAINGDTSSGLERFDFLEGTARIRLALGETSRRFLGSEFMVNQRFPVLELAYTAGRMQLPDASDQRYRRWVGALYQSVLVRRLGRLDWRLEAGYASPEAPFAKLFTLNQSGGGLNILAVSQTFQALPDTLFLHDRYVAVFLDQELGPVLYQRKRSAPMLSVLQSMAWGDLRAPERHVLIGFRSVGRPTFETGLKLDNLITFNYLNALRFGVGGAVFYRWGSLAQPREQDNFSARLTLRWML